MTYSLEEEQAKDILKGAAIANIDGNGTSFYISIDTRPAMFRPALHVNTILKYVMEKQKTFTTTDLSVCDENGENPHPRTPHPIKAPCVKKAGTLKSDSQVLVIEFSNNNEEKINPTWEEQVDEIDMGALR